MNEVMVLELIRAAGKLTQLIISMVHADPPTSPISRQKMEAEIAKIRTDLADVEAREVAKLRAA